MQRFLAILGRQPELSVAELVAVATSRGFRCGPLSRSAALLGDVRDPVELMNCLGGTVKIAEVLDTIGSEDLLSPRVIRMCLEVLPVTGKVVFGFSTVDGKPAIRTAAQHLAVQIKEHLQKNGRNARYVRGKDGDLSSVVVQKQILAHRGAEFVIISSDDRLFLGRTVAVQPFEEFSKRDFHRPGRNARSGMVPPKLARIMVNLSGVSPDETLLDPFCGSGTVLQEAALLGVRNLIGSDSNDRAVGETKRNLEWIGKMASVKPSVRVFISDIRGAAHSFSEPVHAVVTEPFLGPPLAGNESLEKIQTIKKQLQKLYEDAFDFFLRIVAPRGRIVFIQPVFYHKGERLFLMNLDALLLKGFRIVQPLPPEFVPLYKRDLTFRHTLLYHRPDQRLGREILILEKK